MSDQTSLLNLIESGTVQKDVPANALFNAMSLAAAFAMRSITGLTFNYYGARIDGSIVANGSASATASNTNYIVVNRSTYAVTIATSTTNWNDAANYGRMYKLTAGASTITDYEDHRFSYDGTGIFDISGASAAATAVETISTGGVVDTTALPPEITYTDAFFEVSLMAGPSSPILVPGYSLTATGSGSVPALDGTTYYKSLHKDAIAGTGATARAGWNCGPTGPLLFRGAAAAMGGFRFVMVWSIGASTPSTAVVGVGLLGSLIGSGLPSSADPSAQTDCVLCGADTGDTNLQIMHNDSSGTCTKIDLGASFPAKSTETDVYRMVLECAPGNASDVTYEVIRLNTGDTASGTLSTNLPAGGVNMTFAAYVGLPSGGTGTITLARGLMASRM